MYETNRICRLRSYNALNDSTDREAGNEAYDQQLAARQIGTPEILWDGCFGSVAAAHNSSTWVAGIGQKQSLRLAKSLNNIGRTNASALEYGGYEKGLLQGLA